MAFFLARTNRHVSLTLRILAHLALASLVFASGAEAGVADPAESALSSFGSLSPVQTVQYYSLETGNYCWYDDGCDGPGWYLCGDEWLNGFGWGGPYGWNRWGGGNWIRRHGSMESASGILALRAAARRLRVLAPAALRRPPPSRAAAFLPSMVSEAAGLFMAQAWAALRRPLASRAASRLSMVSKAAAGVFMALAAPEGFMAAAVGPSLADTAAAAIAEPLPGYARNAFPPRGRARALRRIEQRECADEGDDDTAEQDFRSASRA